MVLGYGLRFELADRSLDLCGRELHRILPSVWLRLKACYARLFTSGARTLRSAIPRRLQSDVRSSHAPSSDNGHLASS